MDGQGLQPIRSEIEAIVTFQAALNRLALSADENALTEWSGPKPEEIDGLARDDGTFFRSELIDVRKRAGDALATRFREALLVTKARPALKAILGKALLAATGGVASLEGPEAGAVLAALTRTSAIRLDWAEAAAAMVREELEKLAQEKTTPSKPKAPRAKKKKAAAAKKGKPAKRAPAKGTLTRTSASRAGRTASAPKKGPKKGPAKGPAKKPRGKKR